MQVQKQLTFLTGVSTGYFTGRVFGGPSVGGEGVMDPIIFQIGDFQMHLHHWLSGLLVLILFLYFSRKKEFSPMFFSFSLGFFGGLIFQGIFRYGDWYRVFMKA